MEITRISAFKNETKNAQNATAEFPVRTHMTDWEIIQSEP